MLRITRNTPRCLDAVAKLYRRDIKAIQDDAWEGAHSACHANATYEHTHTCNVHMLSASWHRGQLSLTEMFAARMYGESVESNGHPHPRSVAPPVRKCETVELSRRQPGTRRVCGSSTPTPWTQTGQRLSGIRYSTVIPASRCPPTVASHTRTLAHAELLNLSHPPATNHTIQPRAYAQ